MEQESTKIAFLDILIFHDSNDAKEYRGGILVTDLKTYPLEFRITSPIRPTSLQTILYGAVLERYIYTELVAAPLIKSIRSKPDLVLVSSDIFLDARPYVHLPILHISRRNKDLIIKSHPRYQNEQKFAYSIVTRANQSLLLEAFSRVRMALQEAHKRGVGE